MRLKGEKVLTDPLKMDLRCQDVLGERIKKLKELFPEVFTEV
ncbi:hypothetical protein P378_14565 [Desulforamulus profundi]|uniref:Uncharacterized protein n=1 Tax=Desulforamulus profundi TaxID=1383067 RepID=A0A2C6LHC0_9FIRM|nr:hypothetical protein P378_14565 [Desulforamulus profundi]